MNKSRMPVLNFLRNFSMAASLILALSVTGQAEAAQGCGFGLHRGYGGACVFNHPGPYATPAPYHPGCWRNRWGQLRCYRY